MEARLEHHDVAQERSHEVAVARHSWRNHLQAQGDPSYSGDLVDAVLEVAVLDASFLRRKGL